MTEVMIKRVDLYDIDNGLMIIDTIIFNPNITDVIVGIEIYAQLPDEDKLLNSIQPLHISANSYSVFRSDKLPYTGEVNVRIKRCIDIYDGMCQIYDDETESRMNSNIVQGLPPDSNIINMNSSLGVDAHADRLNYLLNSLASTSPITLQSDTITLFSNAPVVFSGRSSPNRKVSIYNVLNNKVLTTAQTDANGKYSVEYHMVTGMLNTVTFSIRVCNTNINGTLDLSNVSNQITMTVKPVSVMKYSADARYTGVRDRENGVVPIPKKDFPSMFDALPALKKKAEELVSERLSTLLRFEYGYESTTGYHNFYVTWYFARNIANLGGSFVDLNNNNNNENNTNTNIRNNNNTDIVRSSQLTQPAIRSLMVWWLLLLLKGIALILLGIALIYVIKKSGLIDLLPDWLKNAINGFYDFFTNLPGNIAYYGGLIIIGYLAIKFGPGIVRSISARRKTQGIKEIKGNTVVSEPKRLTA